MAVFSQKTDRPSGVGIRSWREMAKAGMFAVGMAWQRYFKMLHFAADARSRYGYKPRSAAYRRRKEKKGVPGFLDMVLTGDTRRDLSRIQVPRAFPTRVSLVMPTAAYIQMRPDRRHRNAPNLGEELTRVVPNEVQVLETVFGEVVEPLVAAHLEQATATGR
jgi:hypothetical protein